jgi:hypothetical protein
VLEAAALVGCSTLDKTFPLDKSAERRHNFGSISGPKGIVFSLGHNAEQPKKAECVVNKFLWQGTLDTLSFMKIIQKNPESGRIITDWYIDQARKDVRVRATVQISGKQLRADAVKVSVERQRLEHNTWVEYRLPVQECTKLELLIVVKARKLFNEEQSARD